MRRSHDIVQPLHETTPYENYAIAQGEVLWYKFCNRAKIHPTRDLARMFCGIKQISFRHPSTVCKSRRMSFSQVGVVREIMINNHYSQRWTVSIRLNKAIVEQVFYKHEYTVFDTAGLVAHIIKTQLVDVFVQEIFGFNLAIDDLTLAEDADTTEYGLDMVDCLISLYSAKLDARLTPVAVAFNQDSAPNILIKTWPRIADYLCRQFNINP